MRWRDLPIVAFDTETTGFAPEDGHRVIEIAAVTLRLGPDGRVATLARHEWLVNPEIPIPRDSTDIHHITNDDVAGKPLFAAVADEVWALLDGALVVAHNLPFDRRQLTCEFERVGKRWPRTLAEADTLDLSHKFFREAKAHKLGEVCKRLEIELHEAHRAGNDAEACGRCFVAFADRFGAPELLGGLADWGDLIVDPPLEGSFTRDADGTVRFLDGPQAGEPALQHPATLAWMTMARRREGGSWSWRYPEATRRWVDRYLRLRCSGAFPQHMKGFAPTDWGIDPPLGHELPG